MILSKKMKDLMAQYDLCMEDVGFAYMMANGFSPQEACQIIYHPIGKSLATTATMTMKKKPGIEVLMNNIKEDYERAIKRSEALLGGVSETNKATAKVRKKKAGSLDKETVLEELNIQYQKAKDGKEKADIMMKIADILQVKREEDKAEDKRLVYYLPLRCEICPYKNKNKSE